MDPIQSEFDFARTHARRSDPETSVHAAESMREASAHQCASIFSLITSSPDPLAGEQIADRLGMTTHAVGKRLPDLERDGLIVKTSKRHQNRSGRWAVKWGERVTKIDQTKSSSYDCN